MRRRLLRFERSAAADGDDASVSRLAHDRDRRAQKIEGAVQVHIEHALERGIVSCGDGLAAGEPTHGVSENVQPAKARYRLSRADFAPAGSKFPPAMR